MDIWKINSSVHVQVIHVWKKFLSCWKRVKIFLIIEQVLSSVPSPVENRHLMSPVLSISARLLIGLCLSRNIMCLTPFSEESNPHKWQKRANCSKSLSAESQTKERETTSLRPQTHMHCQEGLQHHLKARYKTNYIIHLVFDMACRAVRWQDNHGDSVRSVWATGYSSRRLHQHNDSVCTNKLAQSPLFLYCRSNHSGWSMMKWLQKPYANIAALLELEVQFLTFAVTLQNQGS